MTASPDRRAYERPDADGLPRTDAPPADVRAETPTESATSAASAAPTASGPAPTASDPASVEAPAVGIDRLARKSVVFTLGNVLAKLSGVLLATLYLDTDLLPFEHFGRLGQVQALGAFVTPVVAMGLAAGMLRMGSAPTTDAATKRALPMTAFLLQLAACLAVFAAAWPLGPWIGRVVVAGAERPELWPQAALLGRLAVAIGLLDALATVPLMRVQAKEKAGWYSAITAGKFALLIAATFGALVVFRGGLAGAMAALAVASGAVVVVTGASLVRHEAWTFRASAARGIVAFGAPLVLVGLTLPVLHIGDRFVLSRLASDADLSLYEAANRLAGVLNATLVQGFNLAFAVLGLRAIDAGQGGDLHRRAFRHLSVGGFGFALGLSLFAYDALVLLAAPGSVYLSATPLVYPLAAGLVFYVLFLVGSNVLYAHHATRLVGAGLALVAALNVGLNVVLVPVVGAMGSALATLLSYAVMAVGAGWAAERRERLSLPWRVPVGLLALTAGLLVASLPTQDWPLAGRLAARAGLLAVYPFGVLALGVYRWADVVEGAAALRAKLGR